MLEVSDDKENSKWSNDYGPYCYNGKCAEYEDVPEEIDCDASPPDGYQRLCHCINPGIIVFSLFIISLIDGFQSR